MRLALVILAVLAVAVPATQAAAPPAETLSIEDARGVVTIRGTGIVIGRLERGEIQVIDLTPLDQWSPRVNGVPRGKTVWTRGKDVNFYIPGGRYRLNLLVSVNAAARPARLPDRCHERCPDLCL